MEARTFRPYCVCERLGLATVLYLTMCGITSAQFVMVPQPMMGYPAGPAAMQPGMPMQGMQFAGSQVIHASAGTARSTMPGRAQHSARSENFIVFADSPDWAAQVAEVAEAERSRLAQHWLGRELPRWPEACPITVQSGPQLGAGGETRFRLMSLSTGQQTVGGWQMMVQGTRERILDSVLPHEITHTIFATHFSKMGKYVPRWADEGACTTVEHESEKRKHRHYLHKFLQTGRGLAFNKMFRLKEYPHDILPLYAQGHSAVQFLIDQSSPQEFIKFIEQGMQTEDWNGALQSHYAYKSIGEFQTLWNDWLKAGSPQDLLSFAPKLQASNVRLASNQSPSSNSNLVPGSSASPVSPNGKVGFAIGTVYPDGKTPAQLVSKGSQTADTTDSWYKRRLQTVTASPSGDSANLPIASTPAASLTQSDTSVRNALASRRNAIESNSTTPTKPIFGVPQRPASVALQDSVASRGSQSMQGSAPLPQGATNLPNAIPSIPSAPYGYRSAANQLPPQSTQVQVIDWGNSAPVRGIESGASTGMVPIYR